LRTHILSLHDALPISATAVLESWRYQELEAIALAQHRALQKLTDLVAERHRKGAASRSDLAQSKTRVESAYTQVLQHQNQKRMRSEEHTSELQSRFDL